MVMQTVRAATLATARRLERLAAAEAETQKPSPEQKTTSAAKPSE